MKIEIQKYQLRFRFVAGTSRGQLRVKDSWFVRMGHHGNNGIFGLGECGPLPGLSPDLDHDFTNALNLLKHTDRWQVDNVHELLKIIPNNFPALKFAIETAWLDLQSGGKKMLFDNGFSRGEQSIAINGLVWMGDKATMMERLQRKIEEGYTCIKIKIGGINFDDELDLLHHIRKSYNADQITIRLDANGAFTPENALAKLDRLSDYNIHSIEQPIMAGQWQAAADIIRNTPIPIALDEELIGCKTTSQKQQLLEALHPHYIILKPTLVGGLQETDEWISIAEEMGIGWWVTSALESNIGLNAIAQFVGNYQVNMPQGLGTGQLYHNNIASPLQIEKGTLIHNKTVDWDMTNLF